MKLDYILFDVIFIKIDAYKADYDRGDKLGIF